MSTIFTGSSRYSSDFAAVIDRAVAIASLPIKQYQQQKGVLMDQETALSILNTKSVSLTGTVDKLASSLSSLSSNVSDASVLHADFAATAAEATYRVSVSSLGSASTIVATEFTGVTKPDTDTYTTDSTQWLAIGAGPAIELRPANHSLQALVDEINTKASADVQATIVNVGGAQPSYQLSLQSKKLGNVSLKLRDGATVSETNTAGEFGTSVSYSVNGVPVTSDSKSVTLAPGVTADLLGVSTKDVTVSLSRSTASFRTAMTNFVAAFNDMVTEVDSHRGNKDAALTGQSILSTINSVLRKTAGAEVAGKYTSLTAIGVEFDRSGKLKIDEVRFSKVLNGGLGDLTAFLGDGKTSGFIKAAKTSLESISGGTGLVSTSLDSIKQSIKIQDERITSQQTRIERLQEDLQYRMTKADAMIAMLEQQVTYFSGMWEAMKQSRES